MLIESYTRKFYVFAVAIIDSSSSSVFGLYEQTGGYVNKRQSILHLECSLITGKK